MKAFTSSAINWKQVPHGEAATAWHVMERDGNLYVETIGRVALCRVGDGNVYFWDKRNKCEVAIDIRHLFDLLV